MPGNIRILAIGDIVGKLGRKTVQELIPRWQQTYEPNVIIGNVENLAHGKGVTEKTLAEISNYGVTICTAGDHIWDKGDLFLESYERIPMALPANDERTPDTLRWQSYSIGNEKIFVLNLVGQVFMPGVHVNNPFTSFDSLYEEMGRPKLLLVDFHTEATSEKVAFGYYADGRASIVYGTHTHIPTADAHILQGGTGYITDVGMTGAWESVLGVDKEVIVRRFVTESKEPFTYSESGPAWSNAIVCDLNATTGKCTSINLITEKLTIN